MDADLALRSLEDVATAIASRRVSPVELAELHLRRIERAQPRLNAFVTVTADAALAEARAAEAEIAAGRYRGALHGVPLAHKDLYATRGVRTTAGSRILADWIPAADATVIAKLRDAGSVLLGKLGMHEFAFGVSSVNPHWGDVHNPWDTRRIPGGSSGGSAAAVSAGLAYASLGSDTGGSIRIPASLCGCVGIKLTYGRASLAGAVPLAWSLDHAGPLARTVRDAAVVASAISGHDPADPASADRPVPDWLMGIEAGPRGLRVGVPVAERWADVDAEIATLVRAGVDALAKAGATVVEIPWARAAAYRGYASTILNAEAAAYHAPTFPSRATEYGPLLVDRLTQARQTDLLAYTSAMRAMVVARAGEADAELDGVDVLAMPTVPLRAWTIDEAKTKKVGEWTALTRIFDLTGQPSISVPCGRTSDGIPAGLMLAARSWDEATLLRAARAYELVRGPFPAPPEG